MNVIHGWSYVRWIEMRSNDECSSFDIAVCSDPEESEALMASPGVRDLILPPPLNVSQRYPTNKTQMILVLSQLELHSKSSACGNLSEMKV